MSRPFVVSDLHRPPIVSNVRPLCRFQSDSDITCHRSGSTDIAIRVGDTRREMVGGHIMATYRDNTTTAISVDGDLVACTVQLSDGRWKWSVGMDGDAEGFTAGPLAAEKAAMSCLERLLREVA